MAKKKAAKKVEPKIEEMEEVNSQEVDIFEGVELDESDEADAQEEDLPVVVEAPKPVEGKVKRLVGHHPITKEPVYK